jgi:nicotinate-nucleotide--dimethylbenzimidazole phosphoribosyltransferase
VATTGATANFEEIHSLVSSYPEPDRQAADRARVRERELTKPPGALGRLETLAEWLAAWQGRHPPRIDRARVAVFVGNHGVAVHGVSAFPSTVTAQMMKNFQAGGAAVNQLCALMDAELKVYEMALDQPTGDILSEPAMSEEECSRSIAYGMMAVEDGLDVICLGEMGIANTTSAAALCLALFGGTAQDWTGPGTGVAGSQLELKTSVVAEAVKLHAPSLEDPLEILRHLGGHELAAIVGAIIAARMARVPVILDGYATTAAAAVVHKLTDGGLDHVVVGHLSAEPAHARLLEQIGKQPLLDLGMRLGEASGAVLALPLVRAAAACHTGMATFSEAGVSEKA